MGPAARTVAARRPRATSSASSAPTSIWTTCCASSTEPSGTRPRAARTRRSRASPSMSCTGVRRLERALLAAEHVAPPPAAAPSTVPSPGRRATATTTSTSPPRMNATARRRRPPARRTPANGSGRRARSPSSRSVTTSSASRRPAARRRISRRSIAWRQSQSTGRRLSGSTSARNAQLVALVDVGHAGRGQLQHELPERGALADRSPPARRTARSRPGTRRRRTARGRSARPRPPSRRSASTQLVFRLASRSAFSMYASIRSAVDRPGADERLEQEVALDVVGRAARRAQRLGRARASARRASAHSSGIDDSAAIRARTSAERLVSWVIVVSIGSAGTARRARRHAGVEASDVDPEPGRVAADVVERQQPA